MTFVAPPELQRYIAKKGSICVDGVSLTVNALTEKGFSVNIVPHTLRTTILGQLPDGQSVNLEVDIIARYLERLMTDKPQPTRPAKVQKVDKTDVDETQSITKQFLSESGFLTPDLRDDEPTTENDS